MPFRRFCFVLFLCLASLLTEIAANATTPEKQPTPKDAPMPHSSTVIPSDISFTYLPNGLTVAVKRDPRFPLASLRLYVRAGSAYETPDIAGISHQLEHMVFKGTENRPKGAIATEVEGAGGYLNAATSFDYTVYLTDMPSEHWQLGLDILKDMAFHPSLDPEELESEKEVVLAELQRGEDSPSGRLFKRVQASVLKGTPYERPIIGYPETIRAYTVAKMREYIEAMYQPQSMLLLVIGDVAPEDVLAEATHVFGGLRNTGTVVPPKTILPEEFPATGPTAILEETPWNKVQLSISFPGVTLNDARAPALDIFSQLLAGDTSSFLYKTYKYDKRLVDSISASSYTFERTGLFTITATLDPAKVAPFWEAFAKDLAGLAKKKFTAQELNRAKLAVTDTLHRQKETIAGSASLLGYFLFFGGGVDAEQTYLQQIDLVDQAAISTAASNIFKPERLLLSILTPKAQPEQTWKMNDADWFKSVLHKAWPVFPDARTAAKTGNVGPTREVIDLGSGRTLILQPDTSMPYTAVDLIFAGGDSLLKPEQQGLAALTAAVLTQGTKAKDAVALEVFKNDRAASLSAGSGRETFRISLDYPARFATDMWELLHEVLTSTTFPEKEVERARENQIAAITSREDQPLGLAFRQIFPFLFGSHPYGFQSQGAKKSVANFTRKDAVSFWKQQSQKPWVLSVCGAFDRDAIIAAAKKLPAPTGKTPVIPSPIWTKKKELTISLPERNQAHLFMLFPAPPVGSEDEAGMNLLQNILAGQSGLLFRDLRDKQGLGYTVTAFQWQAPLAANIMFYIGTEPDKIAIAKEGFANVVASLHETLLPEKELVRGKNQMRGDHVRARQRMSARSAEAANLAILGRSLDAEQNVIDAAMRLTPEDIRDLARRYLVLDSAYVIKVLP